MIEMVHISGSSSDLIKNNAYIKNRSRSLLFNKEAKVHLHQDGEES